MWRDRSDLGRLVQAIAMVKPYLEASAKAGTLLCGDGGARS